MAVTGSLGRRLFDRSVPADWPPRWTGVVAFSAAEKSQKIFHSMVDWHRRFACAVRYVLQPSQLNFVSLHGATSLPVRHGVQLNACPLSLVGISSSKWIRRLKGPNGTISLKSVLSRAQRVILSCRCNLPTKPFAHAWFALVLVCLQPSVQIKFETDQSKLEPRSVVTTTEQRDAPA